MKIISWGEVCEHLRPFLTGGMTQEMAERHSEEMRAENRRTLHYLNGLCCCCAVVMLLASWLLPSWHRGFALHLVFFSAALWCTVKNKHKHLSAGLYTSMAVLYAFAIFNHILVTPEEYAVYICVALAILPTLVVDVYWHTALVSVAAWGLFLVGTICYGAVGVAAHNIINATLALTLGLTMGFRNIRAHAESIALQETVLTQRDIDQLTRTVTRRTGEERARLILQRGDDVCTMFILDVDNFKKVNDTYGHGYGDQILRMVADTLRSSFRAVDLVFRLGGDEFMVLVVGNADESWIKDKSEQVLHKMAQAVPPGGKMARVSVSIGAVQCPKYGTEFAELYRKADHALYKAKRAGKNCYHIFGFQQV